METTELQDAPNVHIYRGIGISCRGWRVWQPEETELRGKCGLTTCLMLIGFSSLGREERSQSRYLPSLYVFRVKLPLVRLSSQ